MTVHCVPGLQGAVTLDLPLNCFSRKAWAASVV